MALRERWAAYKHSRPNIQPETRSEARRKLDQLYVFDALDRFKGAPHGRGAGRRLREGEFNLSAGIAKPEGNHDPAAFLPARGLCG